MLALPLRPPFPIPTCLRDVNQWPHVLLDRACVLWGEGAVREQLRILVQSITSSRLLVSVLSYVIFFLLFLILSLSSGSVCWKVHSLYSGIECLGEALLILKHAVAYRFSIDLDIQHCLMDPHPRNKHT